MTPQELRAQADAMEAESAKANEGKVYVSQWGVIAVHDGNKSWNHLAKEREASEAEVQTLCTIPEFAAYLKKVRGE